MFYTIYKTTCIPTGKYYIGKHQTKDLDDEYLGSGKQLKYAIKKYGLDQFHKEILHICQTEKQMNTIEKILVVPDSEVNYNLTKGGYGSFFYANKYCTIEDKQIHKNRQIFLNKLRTDEIYYKEFCQKCKIANNKPEKKRKTSLILREKWKNTKFHWNGKSHSEETKKRMSLSAKGKRLGPRNGSFGTCWITNGQDNKKINKNDLDKWLELGYYKGRINGN